MKKIFICILGLLTLAGCAHSTKTQKIPILNENQSVYIMFPDASISAPTYLVQQELNKNFQKFSKNNVSTALDSSSIKTGFVEAKKQKADVMVCPMITQWRDSDTPNTGTQDKVGINIRIFDVKSQNVVNEQNLYKKSNIFAFKDASPDVLIPSIIQKYVASLYK